MPKQDGRLSILEKTLEVYVENGEVNNEIFKKEIRKKVLEISKQSAELTDGPALLKKSEIARYFGLVDYSFDKKIGIITKSGKDFLYADKEKRKEIIFDQMNNISFGKNNCMSKSSNSNLNPPILFIKALKEYGSLSRSEFAYLLYAIEDKKQNYNDVLVDVASLIEGPPSHPNENKYKDPKFTVFFEEIGITHEVDKRYYLDPKYLGHVNSLKIFSDISTRYNDILNEKNILENKVLISASNSRVPRLIKQSQGNNTYQTDPNLKYKVFRDNSYECEINPSHKTFKKENGIIYMEGHHLIPMKAQKDFEENIDRIENIVCICPNCHRKVHHGNKDVKYEMLEKLFLRKKDSLKHAGLSINLDDIFEKYYT